MSHIPHSVREAYDLAQYESVGIELIQHLSRRLTRSIQANTKTVLPWEKATDFWENGFDHATEGGIALLREVADKMIQLHHPRYLGHQIAPVLPIVGLAGLLTFSLNNGMGVYEMGMAGTIMERALIEELRSAMGMGPEAGGIMTSGGTLANLTALLAARQAMSPHDIWEDGYADGERLAIMVSAEAHYSVQRAVRIMGWGREGMIKIPVDEQYRLRADLLPAAFQKAKEKGRKVIAVVGSSCSTATGSFDPLDEIGAFCEAENLWFHVDAAHGGPAIFSEREKSLLAGIEKADSVLMDFHKMALCPALCTALIFGKERDSYRTFAQKAAYLWEDPAEEEWYNLGKRTFECTKQMMSLAPYLIMQEYGTQIWGDYVEGMFALGRSFGERLASESDFEVLIPPTGNIVCFRYVPSASVELDQLNRLIRLQLRDEGEFYIVQTEVAGKLYLRTALMNPFTKMEDLEALLRRIREIGKEAMQKSVSA